MKSWEPVIPSSILIRCILERILQKAIFRVLKKNTGEWTGGAYGWFLKLKKNNCIWSALCMINGQYRGAFAEACRITFSMGEAFCRERSEEHTSELQSRPHLVCRLLLEKKK